VEVIRGWGIGVLKGFSLNNFGRKAGRRGELFQFRKGPFLEGEFGFMVVFQTKKGLLIVERGLNGDWK